MLSDNKYNLLDWITVISFIIGLQNLDLNLAQEDLDNQTKELDKSLREVVDDIHKHLKEQDMKINEIMELLNYDKDKEVGGRD